MRVPKCMLCSRAICPFWTYLGEIMRHRSALAMPSKPKYEGVQALRFIAALLVVITHSTFYTHERLDPGVAVWNFGTIGVNIFFVISGFVMMVSTQSLRGTPDAWKYFSVRRLVRIVPMYWIATTLKLLTMVAIPGAVLHAALNPGDTILSYLFLPSRNIDGEVQPVLGVGWTLIFEMFFYAVFALGLFLRANVLLFSGSVLIVFALGNAFRGGGEWPAWAVYFDPIILYFLVGMVIAKVIHNQAARKFIPYALGVMGLVILAMAGMADMGNAVNSYTFRMLISAMLVLGAVWAEPFIAQRMPRAFLFLGAASYSLYLFHPLTAPLVPEVLNKLGIFSGPLSVVLCVLAAIVATSLIYRFVEVPLTKSLQKRVPYMRTPDREKVRA
jgi:exopolysaccharide production protein ExoZ